MCAKKQGLAAGFRGWLTVASRQIEAHVPSMPEAEELRQLLHYRTKVLGWPGRLLESSEHPVREKMTFHIPSHLTIYIPLYP